MLDKKEEELTTVLAILEDIPENINISSIKIRIKNIGYHTLVTSPCRIEHMGNCSNWDHGEEQCDKHCTANKYAKSEPQTEL